MSDTRKYDLEELRRDYKTADSQKREMIDKAARKISRENDKIKSMRESLVKEHRRGNIENIKDIHEFIRTHSGYKNE
jgi:hypothetical protein